jgi:dTDP-glucose 4,6-dehydratase|tara:strand:- start:2701 stop:3624 length:924 start_codon:yes stop_codon:yes gene_type:complete
MKVMVTGCAGFIGSHILENFLEAGHTVVGVDCESYAANVRFIDNIVDENFEYHKKRIGDLSHDDVSGVSLIINLAAETHVDNSINNTTPFVQTNLVETEHLIKLCSKTGVPLLHFSTDEVYGQALEGTYDESQKLDPRNPYSATKAAADHMISAYQNTHDMKATIIRPSNNFGPRQNDEKFIPTIVRSLKTNKKIPVYGKGEQVREWTYVKHTANATLQLAERMMSGESLNEIYNFSTNIEMKNIDLVKTICNLSGYEPKIEFVKDRLGHDHRYSVSSEKISSVGVVIKTDINKELKETVLSLKDEK